MAVRKKLLSKKVLQLYLTHVKNFRFCVFFTFVMQIITKKYIHIIFSKIKFLRQNLVTILNQVKLA